MTPSQSNQPSSRDFAEYGEICRAAACNIRMAVNVILNCPVSKNLPDKKAYDSFLKSADNLSKHLHRCFNNYNECARTALQREQQSETVASVKKN